MAKLCYADIDLGQCVLMLGRNSICVSYGFLCTPSDNLSNSIHFSDLWFKFNSFHAAIRRLRPHSIIIMTADVLTLCAARSSAVMILTVCVISGSLSSIRTDFGCLLHKSHNAIVPYHTMHHFVKEMWTCVHISVTKWCLLGHMSNCIVGFVR